MYNAKDAAAIFQLVDRKVDEGVSEVYTQFPAKITYYDNGICSAKPVARLKTPDGDVLEMGEIKGIPVVFPSGGGGIQSFPIKVGNPVWLECSLVSIYEWLEQDKDIYTPSVREIHNLNDVVAFPCVYPKDKRLGVSNENVSTTFYEVDENGASTGTILSEITQRPDKSVLIESNNGQKVELLPDGNIRIVTAGTVRIENSQEELISLLSEFMELLGDPARTHTNTMIGNMPLNSFADIQALKTRLDTLKG